MKQKLTNHKNLNLKKITNEDQKGHRYQNKNVVNHKSSGNKKNPHQNRKDQDQNHKSSDEKPRSKNPRNHESPNQSHWTGT